MVKGIGKAGEDKTKEEQNKKVDRKWKRRGRQNNEEQNNNGELKWKKIKYWQQKKEAKDRKNDRIEGKGREYWQKKEKKKYEE